MKTSRRVFGLFLAGSVAALAALSAAQYQVPKKDTTTAELFPWPEGARAALSLTFDDARTSQVDVGLSLLEKLGVRATFYVTPDTVRERLDGWKSAVARGHEIGNHTLSHPCTGNYPAFRFRSLEEMNLEGMTAEIDGATAAIVELLSVTPSTFAYPCGQTFVGRGADVKSYVPLVAARFATGRKWLSEDSNDPAFADPVQLLSMESDGKSFADLKTLLDKAREEGRWLILTGHEIGPGGYQTTRTDAIEALVRYAREPGRGVWIDTVGNVAARMLEARRATARPAGEANRRDPDPAVERRIDELVARMTLEEKIGQINMPCVYEEALGKTIPEKMAGVRKFAAGEAVKDVGPGGGFFTLPNTILHEGPRQQAEFLNELQRIALEKTRLGIPLLMTEEGTHGLMAPGATIFPEGPALGSAWDPDLVSRIYAAAAEEGRSIGVHQLFTLVVEPIRDPRLGRNEEAYSEDPYLCARYAEAVVAAVQGSDISAPDKCVAGLCHYPGQSQPASGLERGAMEVSPRTLREVFLPPWEAGIKRGRALGVMATYPAIDGTPAHASTELLTGILRDEYGFEGLVLSEGGGIGTLVYEGLAADQKEAGRLALRAGVDVGISHESGYMGDLAASVREGRVPIALVDRAVRRVLRQKIRLGLFEKPFVDPASAERIVHSREHRDLALEAARRTVVLLKNEGGLLPFRKDLKFVAVIGPNADDPLNQLGDYTAAKVLQPVTTVLEGVRATVSPKTRVTYVKGCDVVGNGTDEIEAARRAAKAADAAIVVVGENEWQKPDRRGTVGEGYDAATLELTGRQQELVDAVLDSGKPVAVVLVNGRPLAIRDIAARAPAIVEAWVCGEEGGRAVAEILFGNVNPGGKLPLTVPRHAGQLPVYYNAKKSKAYWLENAWGRPYSDLDPSPLFPFGHGLSYTEFRYSNLRLDADRIPPNGRLVVSLDVENTGSRAGDEVVQLYVRDLVSSVATPVLELKDFAKTGLAPGEKRTVAFALEAGRLALLDAGLKRVVEPGDFELLVGSSSRDIRLRARFAVSER